MSDDDTPRGKLNIPGWAYVTSGVALGVTAQQMWPSALNSLKSFAENAFECFSTNKRTLEESTSVATADERDSLSMGGVVGRHYRKVDDSDNSTTSACMQTRAEAKRPAALDPRESPVDPEDDNPDEEEIRAHYVRLAELELKRKRRRSATPPTECSTLQAPAVITHALRPRTSAELAETKKPGATLEVKDMPARRLAPQAASEVI